MMPAFEVYSTRITVASLGMSLWTPTNGLTTLKPLTSPSYWRDLNSFEQTLSAPSSPSSARLRLPARSGAGAAICGGCQRRLDLHLRATVVQKFHLDAADEAVAVLHHERAAVGEGADDVRLDVAPLGKRQQFVRRLRGHGQRHPFLGLGRERRQNSSHPPGLSRSQAASQGGNRVNIPKAYCCNGDNRKIQGIKRG